MNKLIKNRNDIDWSVFRHDDEPFITCHCGGRYSSHAKGIWVSEDQYQMHSRRPCPDCGKDNDIHRVSDNARDEWEEVTITKDDVGVMDVKDLLK